MSLNKTFKVFIALLIINLIANSCYTDAVAEDLLEIYLLAKENDPIILQARQNQLAFAENLNIAKAKLLPQAYVTSGQNYINQEDSTSNRSIDYNTNNYSLNITQSIFQMADWVDYVKTKKQILSSLKEYEAAEQALFFRVADQYFAVLAARDQLEASQAITKTFQKRLEQARQKFKVGVIAITSIKEAQTRLDLAQATELIDSNNLSTEKEKLRQIIGVDVPGVAKLKKVILLESPIPEQVELWVEKANKYNLAIQAARYAVEAARENVNSSYSNHLPTVNLTGTISNGKNAPPATNKTRIKQIAVNLQLPLFNGGATIAQNKAAILQANAALQKLELVTRETEANTKISFYTVINNIAYIKAMEQRIASSEIALKSVEAGFKAGTRTMVDLLTADSDLLIAKKDYAQAKYKYILSRLQLQQSTGSLCFKDLEQINIFLEGS